MQRYEKLNTIPNKSELISPPKLGGARGGLNKPQSMKILSRNLKMPTCLHKIKFIV